MVRGLGKAELQSAELDLWASLERVVFLDGRGCLAGLASVWVCGGQGRLGRFSGSASGECDLVGFIFWPAFTVDGVFLDLSIVGVDRRHHCIVLVEIPVSGRFIGSLFGVGFLCQRIEFLDLATEYWLKVGFAKTSVTPVVVGEIAKGY